MSKIGLVSSEKARTLKKMGYVVDRDMVKLHREEANPTNNAY